MVVGYAALTHPTAATAALLRRDLTWRGRRVGKVGDELAVAGMGVAGRLFLDRAIAADAIRQRQQFDRSIQRDRRQRAEDSGHVFLVSRNQLAFQLAVGAVA